jgi:diaminopimelate decarboxylase
MISQELVRELLLIYGSPLYVYDGDRLEKTIIHITQCIPYSHTKFRFASVTNGNIHLLKIFANAGWGLHANTPGDIYLGLQAGFLPQDIVYSGSNLNQTEMEQVLAWGIRTLNLDSLSQLKLCCEIIQTQYLSTAKSFNLGLRLNLPEIMGDSRIGVTPAEFFPGIDITKKAGCQLRGLHFYRGTGTNATTAFTEVMERVIATGKLLPDWQYLDFGGGFGYPYYHGKVAFDWRLFGAEISEQLGKLGRQIELIVEPGRAAIAGCGILLAQVVSNKWQGEKQIVGVDTTVANLSVPSVHGGYREIYSWQQEDKLPKYTTDICGNTTYSRDYLGRNCQLPELEIGDAIAILDVGAYGYAMSSHFLHRPKPAEVLIENGKHRLIRQRENYSVLLANQLI